MCLLCGFNDLPAHLQFNPSVREGYRRCPSSLWECTASIFQWHNESVNIWTHLVPALVVTWSIAAELLFAPEVDWYRMYLQFSLFIIFVGSAVYHTYMPACRTARQYTNLLLYDLLSAVVGLMTEPGGMALMSHSFIARGYRCWTMLPTFLWIAFFIFSLSILRFAVKASTARERALSLGGFCFVRVVLGVAIFVPRIMAIGLSKAFVYHFLSGTLVFLGGFLNTKRFPERYWPGAFDYTIHSHGLWHTCALLSAYWGYYGNLGDLLDYQATPCGTAN